MSTTIEVIMRSYEVPEEDRLRFPIVMPFVPTQTKNDFVTYSGKAAGICYMPDDYCSEGMNDVEKAISRANRNAKSGHYSVYEHAHITMLIHTTKFMAMILNSMYLYSTSEKSARYTQMQPETELEKELYDKWVGKFEAAIKGYYGDLKTDKEIHKLAMENARYLISVFTPTVMEYTVPYNRAILMVGWMDKYIEDINDIYRNSGSQFYLKFAKKAIDEIKSFKNELMKVLDISDKNIILKDHKNVYESIKLFDEGIKDMVDDLNYEFRKTPFMTIDKGFSHTSYDIIYLGSWAQFAQAERHRTIHHSICPLSFSVSGYIEDMYFIPEIIKDSPLESEWKEDCDNLIDNNIMFQGFKIIILESGRYADFILKAKERLCSRAQFEIMRQTASSLQIINRNMEFGSIYDIVPRCKFNGYTCKEPCNIAKWALKRKV